MHSAWLAPERGDDFFVDINARYEYRNPGFVLHDFYTHPEANGRDLRNRSIIAMLKDAHNTQLKIKKFRDIYISVSDKDRSLRGDIERLGFEYEESIVRYSALGWSHIQRTVTNH